jgi:hypothetical protein
MAKKGEGMNVTYGNRKPGGLGALLIVDTAVQFIWVAKIPIPVYCPQSLKEGMDLWAIQE